METPAEPQSALVEPPANKDLDSLILYLDAQIGNLRDNEPILLAQDNSNPNVDIYFSELARAVQTSWDVAYHIKGSAAHSGKAKKAIRSFRTYALPGGEIDQAKRIVSFLEKRYDPTSLDGAVMTPSRLEAERGRYAKIDSLSEYVTRLIDYWRDTRIPVYTKGQRRANGVLPDSKKLASLAQRNDIVQKGKGSIQAKLSESADTYNQNHARISQEINGHISLAERNIQTSNASAFEIGKVYRPDLDLAANLRSVYRAVQLECPVMEKGTTIETILRTAIGLQTAFVDAQAAPYQGIANVFSELDRATAAVNSERERIDTQKNILSANELDQYDSKIKALTGDLETYYRSRVANLENVQREIGTQLVAMVRNPSNNYSFDGCVGSFGRLCLLNALYRNELRELVDANLDAILPVNNIPTYEKVSSSVEPLAFGLGDLMVRVAQTEDLLALGEVSSQPQSSADVAASQLKETAQATINCYTSKKSEIRSAKDRLHSHKKYFKEAEVDMGLLEGAAEALGVKDQVAEASSTFLSGISEFYDERVGKVIPNLSTAAQQLETNAKETVDALVARAGVLAGELEGVEWTDLQRENLGHLDGFFGYVKGAAVSAGLGIKSNDLSDLGSSVNVLKGSLNKVTGLETTIASIDKATGYISTGASLLESCQEDQALSYLQKAKKQNLTTVETSVTKLDNKGLTEKYETARDSYNIALKHLSEAYGDFSGWITGELKRYLSGRNFLFQRSSEPGDTISQLQRVDSLVGLGNKMKELGVDFTPALSDPEVRDLTDLRAKCEQYGRYRGHDPGAVTQFHSHLQTASTYYYTHHMSDHAMKYVNAASELLDNIKKSVPPDDPRFRCVVSPGSVNQLEIQQMTRSLDRYKRDFNMQ